MDKVILVVASEKTDFKLSSDISLDEAIGIVKDTFQLETEIKTFFNNTKGLCECYNSVLAEYRNNNDTRFMILMHDDVSFNYVNVVRRLIELENKYAIIGFAGSEYVNLKASPLTWYTASNSRPETRFGRITHADPPFCNESFFNHDRADILDSAVVAIDGLCIILTRAALRNSITFDEKFKFHFYDLDFCLTALKQNLKIGVMVEPVIHTSVGKGILHSTYCQYEVDFRIKWDPSFK